LYERAAIDDPNIQPFIQSWLSGGEEARVYEGELPNKMVIFDREIVLTVLTRKTGHPASMLVRNAPFARSMSILFDFFWQQSKPLTAPAAPTKLSMPKASTRRAVASNHHSQSARGKNTKTR
jgi:hypothetical protein